MILLSTRTWAEQFVTVRESRRGLIQVQIINSGQIVASTVPNPENSWTRILRPKREPVELPLFRNLNGVFDETRILKPLLVTNIFVIENKIYGVAREAEAVPSAPSYLVNIRARYVSWPELIHLSLPGGALAMAAYIGLFPPPNIGIVAQTFGVTMSLVIAAKFLNELLGELKDLSGGAHLVPAANKNLVRVDDILIEGDRIVDLMVSPISAHAERSRSLSATLSACGRFLNF